MKEGMIVVTGATGNIGRELTRRLLSRGKRVRAVGRDPEKLKALMASGAEAALGSLEDAAFLTQAFRGATAVFAMIPPNHAATDLLAYQKRIAETLAVAAGKARVKHVVTLSSVGAQHPQGTGPIAGLHVLEQRFNRLAGVNALHLRAGFFMENHLHNIALIKSAGINGSPLKPDLPAPMIATRDIAAAAADALEKLAFQGKSARELLGARDVTMVEVTRVLGKAVGKDDLKYVQFPYDEARKAMLGMGLSASVADAFIEMYKGFNEGLVRPEERRSAKNTTGTTIEEFAKTFAAAYGGLDN